MSGKFAHGKTMLHTDDNEDSKMHSLALKAEFKKEDLNTSFSSPVSHQGYRAYCCFDVYIVSISSFGTILCFFVLQQSAGSYVLVNHLITVCGEALERCLPVYLSSTEA